MQQKVQENKKKKKTSRPDPSMWMAGHEDAKALLFSPIKKGKKPKQKECFIALLAIRRKAH